MTDFASFFLGCSCGCKTKDGLISSSFSIATANRIQDTMKFIVWKKSHQGISTIWILHYFNYTLTFFTRIYFFVSFNIIFANI